MKTISLEKSIARKTAAYIPEKKKAVYTAPICQTGYTFATISQQQILAAYTL